MNKIVRTLWEEITEYLLQFNEYNNRETAKQQALEIIDIMDNWLMEKLELGDYRNGNNESP